MKNRKIILAAQFIHVLTLIFASSIFIDVLFRPKGGMDLTIVYFMVPAYIAELWIVAECKGGIYDYLLPAVTLIGILGPVAFDLEQAVNSLMYPSAVTFSASPHFMASGILVALFLNLALIFDHFKKLSQE